MCFLPKSLSTVSIASMQVESVFVATHHARLKGKERVWSMAVVESWRHLGIQTQKSPTHDSDISDHMVPLILVPDSFRRSGGGFVRDETYRPSAKRRGHVDWLPGPGSCSRPSALRSAGPNDYISQASSIHRY